MSKSEYLRRPSGMLKHVVTLRNEAVPTEKVDAVRERFMAGASRFDIARDLAVSYSAVCSLIIARAAAWREEERLARLVPDERRIIVTRAIVHGSEIRHIRQSLPRISMHVAELEARP